MVEIGSNHFLFTFKIYSKISNRIISFPSTDVSALIRSKDAFYTYGKEGKDRKWHPWKRVYNLFILNLIFTNKNNNIALT